MSDFVPRLVANVISLVVILTTFTWIWYGDAWVPLASAAGIVLGVILTYVSTKPRPKPKHAACIILKNDAGLILAVSRKDNHVMWSFPGGKIEDGEPTEVAAARELYEETGLKATQLTLLMVAEDDNYYRTWVYRCDKYEGDIQTTEAGLVKWLPPYDLCNAMTTPYPHFNKRAMEKLEQGLLPGEVEVTLWPDWERMNLTPAMTG